MTLLVIQPAESNAVDCSISSATPNTSFNDEALLAGSFVFSGPGTIYRSLLQFPLIGLPAGALVASANLQIAGAGGAFIGTPTFFCNLLGQTNWTEAATWNRFDGVNLWDQPGGVFFVENEDSYIYPGTGGLLFTSLRDQVRHAVQLGRSSYDPLLRGPEAIGTQNWFGGHSSAAVVEADRPKLEIVYYLPVLSLVDNADGTGAEATITGSEAGSLNTILVAPADAAPLVFSVAGSRTGDGDISLSLANGSYWAYVQSVGDAGNVSSQPVFFTTSGGADPTRIDTDLATVLAAVATRLRTQLSLTEATCYWLLERDDENRPPPTAKNFYITVAPDGGDFDATLFDGGGEHQLTDNTGVVVTIHTHSQLDRGGRDKQVLFNASAGLLPYMKPVLKALAGHDLIINANGDTCLRESIRPVGYKVPDRGNKERWSRIAVYFALSFDWDMESA